MNRGPVTLPVDACKDDDLVERIVKSAASWRLSPYMGASGEMHDSVAAEIRPYVKDILFALEIVLRNEQRDSDEQE